MVINENKLRSLVEEATNKVIKQLMKEGFFNNLKDKAHEFVYGIKPLDGPAENIHDVFASNGWKCSVVEKQPNSLTLACYTKGVAMATCHTEPTELVDDMNAYYQRKGKPLTATLLSDDENGVYIRVDKHQ